MSAVEKAVRDMLDRFSQVASLSETLILDGELMWLNALVSEADRSPDPDSIVVGHIPIRELGVAVYACDSQLLRDEAVTPGYLDYLHQLVSRTAMLASEIARSAAALYDGKGVRTSFRSNNLTFFHHGAETPLALARIELELIGRIRAILIPESQAVRLKAYIAAHHFDLVQIESMTKVRPARLDSLELLVDVVRALGDDEPEVFALDRRRTEVERWRLSPGATARHLASNRKGPDLYRMLSEAVHGGALIQAEWFESNAGELPFGVRLLGRVAEVLRFELTELHFAIERLSKVTDL